MRLAFAVTAGIIAFCTASCDGATSVNRPSDEEASSVDVDYPGGRATGVSTIKLESPR